MTSNDNEVPSTQVYSSVEALWAIGGVCCWPVAGKPLHFCWHRFDFCFYAPWLMVIPPCPGFWYLLLGLKSSFSSPRQWFPGNRELSGLIGSLCGNDCNVLVPAQKSLETMEKSAIWRKSKRRRIWFPSDAKNSLSMWKTPNAFICLLFSFW